MTAILLVEDDADKRQAIAEAVYAAAKDASNFVLDITSDVISTKNAIKGKRYDLLILDIKIPNRSDKPAEFDGGSEVIRWLKGGGREHAPKHVVGITAHDEALAVADPEFNNYLWTLIHFSYTSTAWRTKLMETVAMLISMEQPPLANNGSFRVDLGVVVALDDVELEAVIATEGNWKKEPVRGDSAQYYKGTIPGKTRPLTVIAVAAPNKGLPFAAVAATKMIYTFWPRIISMVGICAGLEGKVKRGDIIVADPCWDWGSGKIKLLGGEEIFEPAPYQGRLSDRLRSAAIALRDDETCLKEIKKTWKKEKPTNKLQLHVSAHASGASVLQSTEAIKRIQLQHKDLRAIEMEAFSIFVASEYAPEPKPECIVIKSVSDYGGDDKADKDKEPAFQQYAAFTSVQALFKLLEKYYEWDD